MAGNLKYYLILNLTVLVWGFTGVLGDQISIEANRLVFFRMGIAFLSLLLIRLFIPAKKKLTARQITFLLLTGVIVSLHWFTFFHSIKVSTVSIGVVCMSSSTLFTALLEPLILKRKYLISEFALSLAIVAGIVLIIGFEPDYIYGIQIGLTSAFLASLFGVLNGKHVQTMDSLRITTYEMFGGVITMAVILFFLGKFDHSFFDFPAVDWVYLLILGLVCTTAAFMVSVWIMKYLTPFTVSLGLNMEPIYAIIIALIVGYFEGKTTEHMSPGFYLGTAIILGSIFLNAYLKKKKIDV